MININSKLLSDFSPLNFSSCKFVLILLFSAITSLGQDDIIIDCKLTFDQAISGMEIPDEIVNQLEIVDVQYYSFDGKLHQGQLVLNKKVKKDVLEVFEIIRETKFPIAKAIPLVKYDWNDDKSMEDNNTSAFNYRKIKGSKEISLHSYGLAIDINPLQNPHIKKGKVIPKKGNYDPSSPGTLTKESTVVKEFIKRGWRWGGNWRSSKDYQHFEKRIK
jgi:hypothetical protein